LKKAIAEHIPNVNINCHSAYGQTGKIEVSWVVGGAKQKVWSEGKAKTEQSHAAIMNLLKTAKH
jgi:hypothetical protein